MTVAAGGDTVTYSGPSGGNHTAQGVMVLNPPGSAQSLVGSRPVTPVIGTVPNTAFAYTANLSIGGIVAIPTGLAAGTLILSGSILLLTNSVDHTVIGNINWMAFSQTPASSTYTDAAAIVISTADRAKIRGGAVATFAAFGTNQANIAALTLRPIVVDTGGFIYLAVSASASNTFVTANAITYVFNASY